MTRKIKLPKGMKITQTKDGKDKIEQDFEAQRRQKPAGQQFWDKNKVRVKK